MALLASEAARCLPSSCSARRIQLARTANVGSQSQSTVFFARAHESNDSSLISTILYSISLNKKLVTRHSQQNSKSVESEMLPGVRLACEWADTLVSCAAAGSPAGGEGGRQGEEESPFAGPSSDNRLADWHRRGGEVSRPRWPSPPPWPPAPYLPHTTLDSANSEKKC